MKILHYVIVLVATVFLSCAISKGIPFDIKKVNQIKLHETTKEEAIAIWGEPYKRIANDKDGFTNVIVYYYKKDNRKYDLLVIQFDDNDVVKHIRSESGNIGSSNVLIETYAPYIY